MILNAGTGHVLTPFTASSVTVENRSTAATTVRVGAADTVLGPAGRETVRVPLDAGVPVECLGPGAVELSWRVDPEVGPQLPDYKELRERAILADPLREAITTAWRKAFDPNTPADRSLPAQLKRFDPFTLDEARNIELSKGFTTVCPGWDHGTSWANGGGKVDLTSLILRNLATAKATGDPVFSDVDRKVTFTFRVPSLVLDGRCTINQQCCTGYLGSCWSTGDYTQWNAFQLTMPDTDVTFHAVAADNPGFGVRIDTSDTAVVINGAPTIRFPGPDWLPDWMNWLTESWSGSYDFKNATQMASEKALKKAAVRYIMQTVVNTLLGQKVPEPDGFGALSETVA
jgi:hypothetical protein